MLAHPRAWSNLDWRSGMFILNDKKQCSKCGEWKDVSEFHKDKSCSDGMKPECKDCKSNYMAHYRLRNLDRERARAAKWQKEHAEQYKANKKKYYQDHPELRDQSKKYYREHATEHKAKALEWSRENPEKRREYRKKWYDRNIEHKRVLVRNRRAKRKGNRSEEHTSELQS